LEKLVTLEFSGTLRTKNPECSIYNPDAKFTREVMKVKHTDTGEQIGGQVATGDYWERRDHGLQEGEVKSFLKNGVLAAISKAKGKIPDRKTPARVRISYDEGSETAKLSVRSKKLKLFSTLWESFKARGRGWRPVYKTSRMDVEVPSAILFDNSYEKNTPKGNERIAEHIRDARIEIMGNSSRNLDAQVRALVNPVNELRYLARSAEVIKDWERKGIPTVTPKIELMDKGVAEIKNLYDPLLLSRGEEVVPNDVYITPEENSFVITGPNKNGKTTYTNSIASAHVLTAAGWKIPAESARISPIDKAITHIVRPGDLRSGTSRYENELLRIKEVFDEVTPNSLVILDEMFTGTKPEDGKIQAEAVLRQLQRTGAKVLISTHYHNLIDAANDLPNATNLYCVAHKKQDDLVYTFKIDRGSSDQSEGLYLARKMGADGRGLSRILENRQQNGEIALRN